MAEKVVLDLGCGNRKHAGAVGINNIKLPGVDVVHNLNKGIPFADNSVDQVYAQHFLEHVDDLVFMMKEIYRVLRPGGTLEIEVPYYASHYAFCDPTHKHFIAWKTFDYFTPAEEFNFYAKTNFRILEKKFGMLGRLFFIAPLFCGIANTFPTFYERFLNHILKVDILCVRMQKVS